jgi:hypothetical protein
VKDRGRLEVRSALFQGEGGRRLSPEHRNPNRLVNPLSSQKELVGSSEARDKFRSVDAPPTSPAKDFFEKKKRLRRLRYRRNVKFVNLTVTLSFGGLLFLVAFEKDYVSPTNHAQLLVAVSWFLMLLSALFGLAWQQVWVDMPIRRIDAAYSEYERTGQLVEIPDSGESPQRKYFQAHLILFFLSVGCLGAYKAYNWAWLWYGGYFRR